MLTEKRIEQDLRPHEGLEWITALRTPQIQKLPPTASVQLSLFGERDLAESRIRIRRKWQPVRSAEKIAVAPTVRSPKARAKAGNKRTANNWPVQSFQNWLKDVGMILKNHIQPRLKSHDHPADSFVAIRT